MGSPAIAVPSLQLLLKSDHSVIGVVSQPDRPAGRGQRVQPSPIAELARQNHLPLFQPERIRGNEDFFGRLKNLAPDLILVVAYGKILPPEILNLPPRRCVNLHFSLLPKYRGASPVAWAILQGEIETGVTTLMISAKLDAGDILLQRKLPIEPEDTTESLGQRLSIAGAEALMETVTLLQKGDLQPRAQEEREATHAPLLKKEDGRLLFEQKGTILANQIRAMTPWPGAFTVYQGKLLKVHRAEIVPLRKGFKPGEISSVNSLGFEVACRQEALLFREVQLEGKRRMSAVEFLKGHPLDVGNKLG